MSVSKTGKILYAIQFRKMNMVSLVVTSVLPRLVDNTEVHSLVSKYKVPNMKMCTFITYNIHTLKVKLGS